MNSPTRSCSVGDEDSKPAAAAARDYSNLPPDIVANIHGRLAFVDRLTSAAVFGAGGHAMNPEAPWLVLPGDTPDTAKMYSVADRRIAGARAPMRDYVIVGSSGGWLVTADKRAQMHLVNPVTGERHVLPAIDTCPFFSVKTGSLGTHVHILPAPFMKIRYGGAPPDGKEVGPWLDTVTAGQMRELVYRKVVLSASPRPGESSYAAMLILERRLGAPMFATADDPTWRVAPSRDGVEDAIHHKGRFYSITYTGVLEAWDRDAGSGEFTSTVVTSSMLAISDGDDDDDNQKKQQKAPRKYLAAAPDGRLMVVSKSFSGGQGGYYREPRRVCFEVQALDDESSGGGRWLEAVDIGEAALFVGGNSSLCVSTEEHPGVKAGCVYFTADERGLAHSRKDSRNYAYDNVEDDMELAAGVYSLKGRRTEMIDGLGKDDVKIGSPLPTWFTPCTSS